MSKYYLVPVTTRGIKVNGKSLYEVLGMLDTELYAREKTRIELTYERKEGYMLQKSGYIQGYNEYTSILYNEREIPERLILREDEDDKVCEFFTGTEVEYSNKSYLDVFRVKPLDIKEYLEGNSSYHSKVEKFIRKSKKKGKSFLKRKKNIKPNK